MMLFGVSRPAGVIGGLLFLVHPAQTESVVWIVERSNVVAMTLLLTATWAWIRYRQTDRTVFSALTAAAFVTAFFFRENAVCFPLTALFIDVYRRRAEPERPVIRWKHHTVLGIVAVLLLIIRSAVLGRFGQSDYWGQSLFANLLTVIAVWTRYLKTAFWPASLSPHYVMDAAKTMSDDRVLAGALCLVVLGAWAARSVRSRGSAWLGLTLLLLYWAPTSNLVPMANLYADRFLYPMLVFAGWLASLGLDAVFRRFALAGRAGMFIPLFALLPLAAFAAKTQAYLPAWKSDVSLWTHAVTANPTDSFAWFSLGIAQEERAQQLSGPEENKVWFDDAERSYRKALSVFIPPDYAGTLFFHLARVNLRQGKNALAREHAGRALQLRPDLQSAWEELAGSEASRTR
jgi:protein O-mannosyl-transferase